MRAMIVEWGSAAGMAIELLGIGLLARDLLFEYKLWVPKRMLDELKSRAATAQTQTITRHETINDPVGNLFQQPHHEQRFNLDSQRDLRQHAERLIAAIERLPSSGEATASARDHLEQSLAGNPKHATTALERAYAEVAQQADVRRLRLPIWFPVSCVIVGCIIQIVAALPFIKP